MAATDDGLLRSLRLQRRGQLEELRRPHLERQRQPHGVRCARAREHVRGVRRARERDDLGGVPSARQGRRQITQ